MIEVILKLYVFVPLILYMVTMVLIINGIQKHKKYVECKGEIIGFHENTSEIRLGANESKAISPVVSYMVDGEIYKFVGRYYSTSMRVGKEVTVMYDRIDRTKATIKTGLYIAPIITGSLAVFFTIPVVIFIIFMV